MSERRSHGQRSIQAQPSSGFGLGKLQATSNRSALAHAEILFRHSFLLQTQVVSVYQGSKSRQHLDRPPRTCLSNSQTPAFSVLAAARFLLQLSRPKRLSIPLRFLFPRHREIGKRLETGSRDCVKPGAGRAVSHRRSTVFKASAAQVPPASVHIRTHTHTYVS